MVIFQILLMVCVKIGILEDLRVRFMDLDEESTRSHNFRSLIDAIYLVKFPLQPSSRHNRTWSKVGEGRSRCEKMAPSTKLSQRARQEQPKLAGRKTIRQSERHAKTEVCCIFRECEQKLRDYARTFRRTQL